ncbi:MAG TPA: sigma-70 family RNA polymerase sigma factor [Luteimonas sp.]|nr:sigma-70 family RNA polymerase sigma factor [Luteimonas sp.]
MNSPIIAGDEPALVRKARWGDHAAFDELYRLHAAAVYTLAHRLTGNPATAEDITQETFLRMLQFLNGFKDGLPLRPWLKRVAANAAIDRLRRDRHHLMDEVTEEQAHAENGTPASAADAAGLLRRLPPLQRTLVWLHEMEGWTHAELAARFRQSPSWSKSIVSRSLAKLRDELETDTGHCR